MPDDSPKSDAAIVDGPSVPTSPWASDGNLYVRRVKALNEIRKLVGSRTELRLPKIVAVGDQSSGKSSALERLTGIKFPVKANICTKAAIVAECHQDEHLEHDEFHIFDPEENRLKPVALDRLELEIQDIQSKMLLKSGKKVCTEEVIVRVSGPSQMDVIVIDLPGIIHTGDGQNDTRELIHRYIEQPETLIMLVSEATRNDETMAAIEMAKKVDPNGQRTLRVLTKFDNFDSEDSKQTAIRLVAERRHDEPDSASGLSPHALACKPNGEDTDYSSTREVEMLEGLGLSSQCAGVTSLQERLPAIFAVLIQSSLPQMRENIESELSRVETELSRIGTEPVTASTRILSCQNVLLQAEKSLREQLTTDLVAFKEAVHEAQAKMTSNWASDKLQADAFTCVVFQGAEALRECTQDVLSWWKPYLQTYVKAVEVKTVAVLGQSLKNASGVPSRLQQVIRSRMDETFSQTLFKEFERSCWEAFDKEADWGTINHYFTSKFDAERVLSVDLVEDIVDSFTNAELGSLMDIDIDSGAQRDSQRDIIRRKLLERKKVWECNFQGLSMHDQQQARLLAAVRAWYTVEKKTFTDVILKATQAHIFKGQRQWVQSQLLRDEEIQEAAVESHKTVEERARLKDLRHRLEKCRTEVKKME
eukprot:TRINITY_DN21226_c0_g1_i4.p1 TRINITY_DN21226_c0_g1~~TRINITY_DN21226_c0_g1_i4.p1  ORF type:complete len:735 (+),score=118.27 TRINITY_DN21226_c0_g1_i4:264-2207(+)